MAKCLTGSKLNERNNLIRQWLNEGIGPTEIKDRVKTKFGVGVHHQAIVAIREDLGLPTKRRSKKKKKARKETALVLAAPTGLVPAKEVTSRLRAMVTHIADYMIEEGILTITIDGREVIITHQPEEIIFEV